MDPITAAVTTVTSLDGQLINTIIGLADGSSGGTIATIAIIVNLIVTVLRNADRIVLLKFIQVDRLIAKIPADVLPAVITALTATATTLIAISSGQDVTTAIVNGIVGSLSAVGIHEVSKPAKKKAKVK